MFEHPPYKDLTPLRTLHSERFIVFRNVYRFLNVANLFEGCRQNIVSSGSHYTTLAAIMTEPAVFDEVLAVAPAGVGKAPVTPVLRQIVGAAANGSVFAVP